MLTFAATAMTDPTEYSAAITSLEFILKELLDGSSDSETSSSDSDEEVSSSSCSDEEETAVLGEVFAESFALAPKRLKVSRYVEDVVRGYSDEEVCHSFTV